MPAVGVQADAELEVVLIVLVDVGRDDVALVDFLCAGGRLESAV